MRDGGDGLLSLRAEAAADGLRLHLARAALLQAKQAPSPGRARRRFAARLDAEARANGRRLVSALRALDLTAGDLPDVAEPRADALSLWDRLHEAIEEGWPEEPARRAAAMRGVEADLLRRFAARINAERQQGLGIDRYVWRSRDDSRVRPLHAAHDDRVFFWDEPPEGGHPGEAFNCRCLAEPLLVDEPAWRPTIDASYGRAIDQAVQDGALEAVGDFVLDLLPTIDELYALLEALRALAEAGERAAELAYLVVKEQLTGLSEVERARRDALLGAARDRARDLAAWLAEVPAQARALVDYVSAVEARPDALDRAHRRGLATRAEVEEAYRARARMRTLAALYGVTTLLSGGVAARGLVKRLLLRGGRRPDRGDDAAARDLQDLARRARARSPHLDWPRIDNPGIVWGKGIEAQGLPWERHLAGRGDLGDWIAERVPNFKTFDFYDPRTQVATSAKTLDTRAVSYVREPQRLFQAIRNYIDRIDEFNGHDMRKYTIGEPFARRLEIALPSGTTPEQLAEILRARAYAESLGIDLEVTFLK